MDSKKQKIIELARSLIGTPYKYAVKPEEAPKYLDCSSFTQYIYKQIGIEIPRSTLLQAAQAGKEIRLSDKPETGDLLFFRGHKGHYDDELFPGREIYIGHVAIYSGNNKAIHGNFKMGIVEEILDKIIKEKGLMVMIKRIL